MQYNSHKCYIMIYCRVLICLCICLTLVFEVTAEEKCDTRDCAPSAFYKAINCTPVFEKSICCPNRYDCDDLYSRIELDMEEPKCYFKGHEYEIGQEIQKEDADLCEKNCICVRKPNHLADFNCTSNLKDECPPYVPTREGCYMRNSIEQCCPTEEICPKEPGEMRPAVCKENGKTYVDGEYIVFEDRPNKICICQENKLNGNSTQLISCTDFNHWSDVHAVYLFHKGCAPVFRVDDVGSMVIHREIWRCQNDNDSVLGAWDSKSSHGSLVKYVCRKEMRDSEEVEICLLVNPDGPLGIIYDFSYRYLCRFGQLTMHFGEVLNTIKYDVHSCITCICIVPPVPTCMIMKCSHINFLPEAFKLRLS